MTKLDETQQSIGRALKELLMKLKREYKGRKELISTLDPDQHIEHLENKIMLLQKEYNSLKDNKDFSIRLFECCCEGEALIKEKRNLEELNRSLKMKEVYQNEI